MKGYITIKWLCYIIYEIVIIVWNTNQNKNKLEMSVKLQKQGVSESATQPMTVKSYLI